MWYWRSLLRVPWTTRISNQPVLKEINPEYSLEGLMLKLKLQCFGHLMWRANSLEKTLMLGQIDGRRRDNRGRAGWMASPTQWTWVWENSGRWWRTGKLGVLQSMGLQRVRHNWTLNKLLLLHFAPASVINTLNPEVSEAPPGRAIEGLPSLLPALLRPQ